MSFSSPLDQQIEFILPFNASDVKEFLKSVQPKKTSQVSKIFFDERNSSIRGTSGWICYLDSFMKCLEG
jgi:hypothetical protein